MYVLAGKRVLITGACGTIGSKLVETLLRDLALGVAELIGIDNNESELFFLEQLYLDDSRASFFLGDVRDLDFLRQAIAGIDVVFHAAALKHVVLCERSPIESVMTNIMGVQNIVVAARANGVERVIFTSSDKAVNPTNVMGTSKLMGERLITAANSVAREGRTLFSATRFGNVLGSRGSVMPIFLRQIAKGGPVTLTHRDMTRFVMTIDQAVSLVVRSATFACGGEVFVTKMPVMRISDLARAMIDEAAPLFGREPGSIAVTEIGVKPGEKNYEELISLEETRRCIELEDYFVILPAFRGMYRSIAYDYAGVVLRDGITPYISHEVPAMSQPEIRRFLRQHRLLATLMDDQPHPDRRYWPGDQSGDADD